MVAFNKELNEKYEDIMYEILGGERRDSKNELNLLQNKLKDLENENEMLNLSYNNLKKSVENMVWAKDDCKYTFEVVTRI